MHSATLALHILLWELPVIALFQRYDSEFPENIKACFFHVPRQTTFDLGLLVGMAGFFAPIQVDIAIKFLIVIGF